MAIVSKSWPSCVVNLLPDGTESSVWQASSGPGRVLVERRGKSVTAKAATDFQAVGKPVVRDDGDVSAAASAVALAAGFKGFPRA